MTSLRSLFDAFSDLRVLIVGDVMIDSYLWGKVERISPEAPVPIVQLRKQEQRLGGAANVALNVRALGAKATIATVVGDDAESQTLFQLFQEADIDTSAVVRSAKRPTTIKHRILAGSQHLLRVDSETTEPITQAESQELIVKIQALLPQTDVLIFEDYDKGVLTAENIALLIEMAQRQQIPTVVDPKKRNFLSYRGATLFKPNLKELKEGLGYDFNIAEPSELEKAVEKLKALMPVENVLITLSERGVFMAGADQKHHIAAHKREIADVSGAGDTVVSIAALVLALGEPLALVAELANLGGGLVCESLGVVPIQKNRLLQEAQNLMLNI
ncbi:bifunctional heptose 7-phosphate kinase/heptose 1-phosphate adenyltransferase [Hugenholtzia roseola]|uniref:bifunctional heptose 7-phosphate kinase/heptose 1-phosphate adenyltransferase n=1 Tax=Hugenholtzia roseola TaxID=1002 RepID=UPI00041948CF|nr:bifunctional ADP-heptose synthase [Hugenholtzia roseola]